MPKIPTDMEALAKRTKKDRRNLKERQERNAEKHQLTREAAEELGRAAASKLGVDPGNVQVFMCNRGRR